MSDSDNSLTIFPNIGNGAMPGSEESADSISYEIHRRFESILTQSRRMTRPESDVIGQNVLEPKRKGSTKRKRRLKSGMKRILKVSDTSSSSDVSDSAQEGADAKLNYGTKKKLHLQIGSGTSCERAMELTSSSSRGSIDPNPVYTTKKRRSRISEVPKGNSSRSISVLTGGVRTSKRKAAEVLTRTDMKGILQVLTNSSSSSPDLTYRPDSEQEVADPDLTKKKRHMKIPNQVIEDTSTSVDNKTASKHRPTDAVPSVSTIKKNLNKSSSNSPDLTAWQGSDQGVPDPVCAEKKRHRLSNQVVEKSSSVDNKTARKQRPAEAIPSVSTVMKELTKSNSVSPDLTSWHGIIDPVCAKKKRHIRILSQVMEESSTSVDIGAASRPVNAIPSVSTIQKEVTKSSSLSPDLTSRHYSEQEVTDSVYTKKKRHSRISNQVMEESSTSVDIGAASRPVDAIPSVSTINKEVTKSNSLSPDLTSRHYRDREVNDPIYAKKIKHITMSNQVKEENSTSVDIRAASRPVNAIPFVLTIQKERTKSSSNSPDLTSRHYRDRKVNDPIYARKIKHITMSNQVKEGSSTSVDIRAANKHRPADACPSVSTIQKELTEFSSNSPDFTSRHYSEQEVSDPQYTKKKHHIRISNQVKEESSTSVDIRTASKHRPADAIPCSIKKSGRTYIRNILEETGPSLSTHDVNISCQEVAETVPTKKKCPFKTDIKRILEDTRLRLVEQRNAGVSNKKKHVEADVLHSEVSSGSSVAPNKHLSDQDVAENILSGKKRIRTDVSGVFDEAAETSSGRSTPKYNKHAVYTDKKKPVRTEARTDRSSSGAHDKKFKNQEAADVIDSVVAKKKRTNASGIFEKAGEARSGPSTPTAIHQEIAGIVIKEEVSAEMKDSLGEVIVCSTSKLKLQKENLKSDKSSTPVHQEVADANEEKVGTEMNNSLREKRDRLSPKHDETISQVAESILSVPFKNRRRTDTIGISDKVAGTSKNRSPSGTQEKKFNDQEATIVNVVAKKMRTDAGGIFEKVGDASSGSSTPTAINQEIAGFVIKEEVSTEMKDSLREVSVCSTSKHDETTSECQVDESIFNFPAKNKCRDEMNTIIEEVTQPSVPTATVCTIGAGNFNVPAKNKQRNEMGATAEKVTQPSTSVSTSTPVGERACYTAGDVEVTTASTSVSAKGNSPVADSLDGSGWTYENGVDAENDSRAFFVLDEVQHSDDDDDDDADDGGDSNDDLYSDDSLSDEDIDNMLEEGYLEGLQRTPNEPGMDSQNGEREGEKPGEFMRREKIVLVEKSADHFEVLPDGWITVCHTSGMPVYLHRTSRVCTFSKPYFLGTGSCRNHRIPLSAIPCLDYMRALEAEKEQPTSIVVNGQSLPKAKVVTSEENSEERQISPNEVNEYCAKRFQFKKLQILRFRSWRSRRKFWRMKRREEERPTLPNGSKLITCPIRPSGSGSRPKEWVMNPNGKTYVCILHDYVQRALKDRPVYTFKELENTSTPYLVSIAINGIEYGNGIGSSKKLAKMEAAKATLEILIPGMKEKIAEDPKMTGRAGEKKGDTELTFFDDIKITDPRVVEFCEKTTEPLPHAILLTCLQRNFGLNEMNVTYEMKPMRHSTNEFTMRAGTHVVTVECQNKKDGKQRASQLLLQELHPYISSWGSILRLYGTSSVKSFKEKKAEEQEITALQSKGVSNGPNIAILDKLKSELVKIADSKKAIKPLGVFVPPVDVKMPSSSFCELTNVQL